MRRLLLPLLLFALLLSGCGVTRLSLSSAEPTSSVVTVSTAGVSAVLFSAEETRKMSNFMLSNRFVHTGKTLYGSRHDSTGAPYLCRMKFTSGQNGMYVRETETIETGIDAQYLAVEGDVLYYLRVDSASGSAAICRLPSGSSAPEVLDAGPCDFLSLHGERLYFTDAEQHFCSMKPDGSDRQTVLGDKAVYYPYLISDDFLLYQDDADGESLHLRYLPTGFDCRVAEGRMLGMILQGSMLYFLQAEEGESCTLCRTDLSGFLSSFRPTEHPDATNAFSVERGGQLGPRFSINGERVNASNYQSCSLELWQSLTDTAAEGFSSACQYVSEEFEIFYDYNAGGLIEKMLFYEPSQKRADYIEVYQYQ